MNPNIKGALLGLGGFVFFSMHDAIIKYLGGTYSPYQIVFFSVLFGFPLVSLFLVTDAKAENLRPRHPWWSALRTAAVVLSLVCVFYAFSVLPIAQTYAMLFTMPLWVTLLSIPILSERVGPHRFAAILAGMAGILVVLRPGSGDFTWGHGAALVGAFGSALASTIVRRVGHRERNVVLLLFPMLATVIAMGVLMPFYYQPAPFGDMATMALLAALSLAGFMSMIAAYKAGEAVVIAPMQYSQIVWAILFGFFFFEETPDTLTLVGAGLVIASGLYIVQREARVGNSENTPVLRSRSRIAAGGYFSIGVLIRAARRRKKAKAEGA